MEFGLLAAVAVAFGSAWAVLRLTVAREERRPAFDRLISAAVVGLVAGRIAAMALAGTNPITRPLDVLIVRGGVDTGFAASAALAWLAFGGRGDLWRSLDAVAPAALAGLAGWHLGCLFSGTCLGTTTSLPWGITATGGMVTRHPTEMYAALAFVAAAALVAAARRQVTIPGILAAATLAAAALIRLATEPMRLGIGTGPEWWYASGIAVGVGIVLYRVVRARRLRRPAPS
ncbi:MAG: prolipoprotein diacylglyceryl transferase family protein [Acidimicrobiia bacterium]